jgi:hypothetical protein
MKLEHTLTAPTGALALLSVKPKLYLPSFFPDIVQVLAKASSECAVRISSQSFERAEECAIAVMAGNFNEANGTDSVDAFLAMDPVFIQPLSIDRLEICSPCDISKERESLTIDVQRKLRSLDAVSSCLPSFP